MKIFFGSLYHMFYRANKVHITWCVAILLIMLLLAILHHRWRDDTKKLKIWRFLCLIPLLTVIVHFVIYAASFPLIAENFIPLYIIGILALIPIPFAKRKIGYPITATLAGVISVLCGFYFSVDAPNIGNYANMSYTDSFHAMVQEMDKKYVLKEWKEIDFSALEAKYMPAVEKAEKEQDPTKFADAVTMFCDELHDGHVGAITSTISFDRHEYGLAMIRLDNNDVIAVCTTEKVNKLGIEDGTVITKWNGKPVLQAAQEDVLDSGVSVKATQETLAVIELSGIGGDTVEVTFIDGSGAEQTVTLSDLGKFHTFREASLAFSHEPDIKNEEELQAYLEQNFSTKMLTDKCGYLMLSAESFNDDFMGFKETISYLTGNSTFAKKIFREGLRDLRSQGMEYLVIDLRNNCGGLDVIGCTLCGLLTDEDWYAQGLGICKNGQYISVSDQGIHGDGEFADLQVVAITNYACGSAGDGTALYLSKLPNVTLAGITDPGGYNQETGGACVLTDGIAIVNYPTGLVLNEDGEPNIDTRSDRISRNPVEVRIPLDHDAAMRIFRDKEDYELNWAIQYLEQNAKK